MKWLIMREFISIKTSFTRLVWEIWNFDIKAGPILTNIPVLVQKKKKNKKY